MKTCFPRLCSNLVLILFCRLTVLAADPATEPNTLTAAEKDAGWRLLFDGKTTNGWRNFKKPTFPAQGWVIEDGWLKKVAKVRGGDIVTEDEFNDFELQWEWRIAPKGNNGIKYFVSEERPTVVGPEYQMADDMDSPNDKESTAAFYNVLAPRSVKPMKPAGEVNQSRLVVRGNHVEHWLNGARVLTYELDSDEVKDAVTKSKFKNTPGFPTKIKGHILLTDHRDETSFRNIKIRPLN